MIRLKLKAAPETVIDGCTRNVHGYGKTQTVQTRTKPVLPVLYYGLCKSPVEGSRAEIPEPPEDHMPEATDRKSLFPSEDVRRVR
jgi:hypothetical protein